MAHIKQIGKNKFLIKVSGGYDKFGNRIRITKTFNGTKKEAEKYAETLEGQYKYGRYNLPHDITLQQWVNIWLEDKENKLAPSTFRRYKLLLNRILPALGDIPIIDLRPITIKKFFTDLEKLEKEGEISKRTVLHHYRCLHNILESAYKLEIISQNPIDKVPIPEAPLAKIQILNEEQLIQFFKALKTEKLVYQVMVMLPITMGLRSGEVAGLEWKDIDFKSRIINITKARQYTPGYGAYIKEPKTESSKRVLYIPDIMFDLLTRYRKEWLQEKLLYGNKRKDTDFVICTIEGNPYIPHYITQWFSRFLKRHNLPHITYHSLRHLNATLLNKAGVPLKDISSLLGHSRANITADVYTHVLNSSKLEAAQKINNLLMQIISDL